MGRLVVMWFLAGTVAAAADEPALLRFDFAQTEMAVPVKIVLYAPDAASASRAAGAAFARFHELNAILSDYDPASELRRLCTTAGEGRSVTVSNDLWRVLTRAVAISQQSDGAFDVTIGPVTRLWRRARRHYELPPAAELDAARALVDFRQIRLLQKGHRVELLRPGMLLDLGGVAKGYAASEALTVLRRLGIPRALVEAGGDMALGDPPPDKPGWRIGIAAEKPRAPPSRHLWLSRVSVSTSGDLWQYVEIGGRRYSHLIDPRTGLGLTDRSTATVVVPEGTNADGLASAVCILGPQRGLKMIEAVPGATALLRRAPEGKVETFESSRWKELKPAE